MGITDSTLGRVPKSPVPTARPAAAGGPSEPRPKAPVALPAGVDGKDGWDAAPRGSTARASFSHPTAPGRHDIRLVWDEKGDFRGDTSVIVLIHNQTLEDIFRGGNGARLNPKDPAARAAAFELKAALLAYDARTEKDATDLSPAWYRNPSARAGEFAFGSTHLREDGSEMAYSAAEGPLQSMSPAARRVYEAARALVPFLTVR